MAPLTINGNVWDPATLSSSSPSLSPYVPRPTVAANAEGSDYILIQAKGLLSNAQKLALEQLGVKFHSYVDTNTYLCGYKKTDLEPLRALAFLKHVDVYHPFFKIKPELLAGADSDSAPVASARAVPPGDAGAPPTAGSIPPTTSAPSASSAPSALPDTPDSIDVIIQLHQDAPRTTSQLVDDLDKSKMLVRDQTDVSTNMIFTTVPRSRLAELAAITSIRAISENYDDADDSNIAVTVLNAPVYMANPADTLGLTKIKCRGALQTVHIVDTGFDLGDATNPHPAFTGRVRALYNAAQSNTPLNDVNKHGTHVAGCAVGNGSTTTMGGIATTGPGQIRGAAPAAGLVCTRRTDANDKSVKCSFARIMDRPYTNDGARISNHSYSVPPDAKKGQIEYGLKSEDIDKYVLNKQDLLLCWSAGNSGRLTVPAHQIGSYSACKNVLTVGNSFNARQMDIPSRSFNRLAASEADTYQMASTSSRGPTKENRIKPDVCAPGATILSALTRAWPTPAQPPTSFGISNDSSYFFDSGTSMSAPLVAGCAAVLREALGYQGVANPSAALLKALLINGAVDILNTSGSGLTNAQELQGFGRVNMGGTMHSVLSDKTTDAATKAGGFIDAPDLTKQMAALGNGEAASFTLHVPAPKQVFPQGDTYGRTLKVTLTWMDTPGKLLVDCLGLSVTADAGERRHGNMGSTNMSQSKDVYDRVNNVQQVLWDNVPTGKVYVAVQCYHTNLPGDKIRYALAWSLE